MDLTLLALSISFRVPVLSLSLSQSPLSLSPPPPPPPSLTGGERELRESGGDGGEGRGVDTDRLFYKAERDTQRDGRRGQREGCGYRQVYFMKLRERLYTHRDR